LGKNILGSGYDLELYVHCAGAYICGEETALIESLKEKRKSSYQTTLSCYFRMANPTVVNNVETIAAVPWIVNNSGGIC
jgi:NADH-quinone oxidoreductase subunit F